MPELTPRMGIKKPLGNETVRRAAYNENWDIIDSSVAKKSELDTTNDLLNGHSHDGELGNGRAVSEWSGIQGVTYARVSGNTFTVTTDRTDTYKVCRLVKITSADPTVESVTRVTAVSYDDLDGKTTVVLEDSVVGIPLAKVQYAILDQIGTAIYGYVDTTAFLMSIISK
jgi:hypothetical protein